PLPGHLREYSYAIKEAQGPEKDADNHSRPWVERDAEQQGYSAQAAERGQPVCQEPARRDDTLPSQKWKHQTAVEQQVIAEDQAATYPQHQARRGLSDQHHLVSRIDLLTIEKGHAKRDEQSSEQSCRLCHLLGARHIDDPACQRR